MCICYRIITNTILPTASRRHRQICISDSLITITPISLITITPIITITRIIPIPMTPSDPSTIRTTTSAT